jgi:hypothetical protein
MKIILNIKDVIFKPFLFDIPYNPEVIILNNIDVTNLLALLDLFIPFKMYIIIAENTSLYAITNDIFIARTLISKWF